MLSTIKMILRSALGLFLLLFCLSAARGQAVYATSMGKVELRFSIQADGDPAYSVSLGGKPVIDPSALGFVLNGGEAFDRDFRLLSFDTSAVDETWTPVWGEVSRIRNHYKQSVFHLQHGPTGRHLDLIFRVFEEGVAFRYAFPAQRGFDYFTVTEERTSFTLTGDHKVFWIPGDYDSNEYPYTTSALSEINNHDLVNRSTDIAVRTVPDTLSVQTPLMMKTREGLYVNIHEAALLGYPAMQLHVNREHYRLTSSLVPDAVGNKAYLQTPFQTPWRTIIVSDNAPGVLASHMILNLNEPSRIEDPSWIRPMKFVGVWWEMQTGKGSWSYAQSAGDVDKQGQLIPSGRHSARSENVKRYIDFAAQNGIPAVLIEGWNVGWEDWFGNWKERVFDFVTPYPDFDVSGLQAYAAQKGVHLIMHHETSGSVTNYERQMDTAFRFMKQYGYTAVKTGYVGRIIPRGEHHDGQWMVEHFHRVAEKAAACQVMIDVHEPMRPTGLQRTYPNWMASEAGRGNEYNAFSNGNAPEHETILPFTRLMGGPMDYTPGIFKLKGYSWDSTRQVHTTLAKQLALYVTLYSPLQMVADLPENYAAHSDAFQFIKDVAVDWDTTCIMEAEPGDYITIARKEKAGGRWFIGAITDENSRTAVIPLTFLTKGAHYVATIYADAPDADWQKNPEAYVIKKITVDAGSRLTLPLARGGGVAVSLDPLSSRGRKAVTAKAR